MKYDLERIRLHIQNRISASYGGSKKTEGTFYKFFIDFGRIDVDTGMITSVEIYGIKYKKGECNQHILIKNKNLEKKATTEANNFNYGLAVLERII